MTLEADITADDIRIRWSAYIGDKAVDAWRISVDQTGTVAPPAELFVNLDQLAVTIPRSVVYDFNAPTLVTVEPILLSDPDRTFERLMRGFMLEHSTVLPWRPPEGSDEKHFAPLVDVQTSVSGRPSSQTARPGDDADEPTGPARAELINIDTTPPGRAVLIPVEGSGDIEETRWVLTVTTHGESEWAVHLAAGPEPQDVDFGLGPGDILRRLVVLGRHVNSGQAGQEKKYAFVDASASAAEGAEDHSAAPDGPSDAVSEEPPPTQVIEVAPLIVSPVVSSPTVVVGPPPDGPQEGDIDPSGEGWREASEDSIVNPALSIEFVDARSVVIRTPTTPWETGRQRLLRWGPFDQFVRSEPNNDTLLPGSIATPGRVTIGGLKPGGEYVVALFEGGAGSAATHELAWRMSEDDPTENTDPLEPASDGSGTYGNSVSTAPDDPALEAADDLPSVTRRATPQNQQLVQQRIEGLLSEVQRMLHDGAWEDVPGIELDIEADLTALRSEMYPASGRDPSPAVVETIAARLSDSLLDVDDTSYEGDEVDARDAAHMAAGLMSTMTGDPADDGRTASSVAHLLADQLIVPEDRPEGLDVTQETWRDAVRDFYEQRVQVVYYSLGWSRLANQFGPAAQRVIDRSAGTSLGFSVGALLGGAAFAVPGAVVGGVVGAVMGWILAALASDYEGVESFDDPDGPRDDRTS